MRKEWYVEFHDEFEREFDTWDKEVQDDVFKTLILLERYGPGLGRPHVDGLNGSEHPNMKELRVSSDRKAWRIAFAFDPERQAILLTGGSKSGVNQRRFYKQLIAKADQRYRDHLKLRT